jgi:hypothetical protein
MANAQTGSISSIIDQLDWSSAGTDSASGYQFSSLSSVYSIADNGYYEDSSAPASNHTDMNTYNDNFSWTVPVSVHHVQVWIATVEREFSFNLMVTTNDVLSFDFEKATCGGEGGVSVSYNSEQLVYVPGLNDCAGSLYYGNGVIAPESYATLGNHWVSLSFASTCPKHYTNLKSDFNPVLLPDSSLYIVNDSPLVRVNFQLPAYYYNVDSEYVGQCSQKPSQTYAPNSADGCLNDYTTEIDYVAYCDGFVLDSDASNPNDATESGYSYSGKLTISAKLDLNVAGFAVTRSVSSPLNWRVFIQKTIEVSSDVEIVNDHVCVTEAECNSNGCCVDGVCDCDCAEHGNGYSGTYCEEDITPPTCSLGDASVTIQSNYGGCAKLYTNWNAPVFADNSGETYVLRNYTLADGTSQELTHLFPSDNSDIASMCFDIGTHKIQWHVQDVPLSDPHTDNDHALCSLTVIVEDNEAPHVDCHGCQTKSDISETQAAICTGADVNSLTRSVVNIADLADYFNDQAKEDGAVAYPGTVTYNGFIDCDCAYAGDGSSAPPLSFITNTWGSWENGEGAWATNGEIRIWDIVDANPQGSYPTKALIDGIYTLTYAGTDDSSNSYSCNIAVTYDITAPTCDDFIDENVAVDVNNKNYSVAVNFDETPVHDFDISGKDQGPVMWPQRTTGDVYHVGYAYNATYESIWWLTDLAGNNGTCTWRIIVQNAVPCIWPEGDDLPPYLVDGTCPSNIDIACADNSNCGCGAWTSPEFKDDKFVQKIEVYLDGALHETYNNDPDSDSTLNNQALKIGTSNIKYIAYDMHGKTAECSFSVKISDTVAPVVDANGCPSSETLSAKAGLTVQDYSYSFAHADACSLNSDVRYNGHRLGDSNSTFDNGSSPSDSLSLSLGTHTFRYTIKDDQNNAAYCVWDVTVNDDENPAISCPENILVQISQGEGQISVNFEATATDNDAVASITYASYQPGDSFVEGSYTITATATDNYGNKDTCTFDIVVEAPYPFATLDAALSSAIVSEVTTADDTERVFGATLIVTTLTNKYHKLLSQPNGLSKKLATVDNDNHHIQGEITELAGECASDAAICVQNFEITVEFDSCEASDKIYDLNAEIDCLPTNCTEANVNEDITVSLTASNYCWQDLASVDVSASFINLDGADYDSLIAGYDAATFTLPTGKSVFNNKNVIGGVIHVTSSQVEIDGVSITSLKQEFFGDENYSVKADEFVGADIGDITYSSLKTIAGFKYLEDGKLDLNQSFYTRYSATVSVGYAFGQGSRRMLLNAETQRQLAQDDEALEKDATSDALMMPESSSSSVAADAAVVVVKINNCNGNTYENALSYAIAKYLHIDAARVNTEIDATSQGYCLAEVAISQSNCAGNIDILTLIQYLQEGTQDSFSELHTYFTQSPDVSSDVSLDANVFFVSQTPSAIYEAAQIASSSSSTTSDFAWYYYVAAGVVVGMIIVNVMYNKYNNKGEKSVKHQPLQAERRYSIADLLAATERRSSIDVANVRLHSAF